MRECSPGSRNLAQWLDYQLQIHPQEVELGLARVAQVAQALKLLPVSGISVVVAGTNGKGSSVALLEAIYRAAGYRVGSYTSPHLHEYRERVRIDGIWASESQFCTAFDAIEQARGDTPLTFFEFGTLAALLIMKAENLDLLLLEVGLGGRLDAVNIVDGSLALITQIDLDHREWLGNTRETVGQEKAGIMRAGRPVVCADRDPPDSVTNRLRELGAKELVLGRQFDFDISPAAENWQVHLGDNTLQLPRPALTGLGQLDNAAAALQVVELLQPQLPVSVVEQGQGLRQVKLAGRFEYQPGDPPVIFDVAHNPHACRALAVSLAQMGPVANRYAILGMLADKDIAACLEPLLGLFDVWYLTSLEAPRGASASELQSVLMGLGCDKPLVICNTVQEAFGKAKDRIPKAGLLVVFGSFHTVAAAR
jgi:dihydrofolate synthase/folylpolyglutamate synthase